MMPRMARHRCMYCIYTQGGSAIAHFVSGRNLLLRISPKKLLLYIPHPDDGIKNMYIVYTLYVLCIRLSFKNATLY